MRHTAARRIRSLIPLAGLFVTLRPAPASAAWIVQQRAPVPVSTGASGQPAIPRTTLAFQGVTVVDVTTGRLVPEQTVVVVGNRVHAVGPAGKVRLPKGVRLVGARGKYLIPGLWDMHVHVWDYPHVFYPLLIANGVTGIRQMGTMVPLDTVLLWRQDVTAGRRIGPRQVIPGDFLQEGPPGSCICPFGGRKVGIEVNTPERARHVVDSLKAAGADFIKVHDVNARPLFFAIAAEARRVGIPFVGHLPDFGRAVGAGEASDSGMRTIEHGVTGACFGDSASARACSALVARLARNDTWLAPTMFSWPSRVTAREFVARRRYWPDSLAHDDWVQDSTRPLTDDDRPRVPADALALIHQTGTPVLLAGTDASPLIRGQVPGFSLQDQLALFVERGLTPLEALRAATLNPAKALHAADSLGTIEAGKLADLVLLDADPLTDIRNTRRIRAVVAAGVTTIAPHSTPCSRSWPKRRGKAGTPSRRTESYGGGIAGQLQRLSMSQRPALPRSRVAGRDVPRQPTPKFHSSGCRRPCVYDPQPTRRCLFARVILEQRAPITTK